MCVSVKVQLVQVTRGWSVEAEILVRTCASRLLDSQLHNICSGLEKMGGNLKKKTDDKYERIKEIWQNCPACRQLAINGVIACGSPPTQHLSLA